MVPPTRFWGEVFVLARAMCLLTEFLFTARFVLLDITERFQHLQAFWIAFDILFMT